MAEKRKIIRVSMNPVAHEQRIKAARLAMFNAWLTEAKDG
jgi:hypothetical protein